MFAEGTAMPFNPYTNDEAVKTDKQYKKIMFNKYASQKMKSKPLFDKRVPKTRVNGTGY